MNSLRKKDGRIFGTQYRLELHNHSQATAPMRILHFLVPAFALLIVGCTSSAHRVSTDIAADDIAVTTTVKPHPSFPGQTTTREVFTRGGQTDLVRVTTIRDGMVISSLHRFYYKHTLVADHMLRLLKPVDGISLVTTSGFSINLELNTNNQILEAYIGDRKGNILDAFTNTNGILFPVSKADLKMIRHSIATRGEGK